MSSTRATIDARRFSMRETVLEMCRGRGKGYAGQGLALVDLLACLYFEEMRTDASGDYIDQFVLSTGHSAIAVFAALHECGIYSLDELRTYGADGSRIEESPLEDTPGFRITGGSLGQGLSQAVGLALGLRARSVDARVYCLLSDGELQEGQVWEAAMSAAHYRLDNLVALIDNNAMQADGAPQDVMGVEPVDDKFSAFGFATRRINGHDVEAIREALQWARHSQGVPAAIVCDTIPGFGVPLVESRQKTHYVNEPDEFWVAALTELRGSRSSSQR